MDKNIKKEVKKEIKRIEGEIKKDRKGIHGIKEKHKYMQDVYKKFDIIYIKYGQETYTKYVPKKYRCMDQKRLLFDGRFIELYNKHGEKAFKAYESDIKAFEIYNENGSKMKMHINSLKTFATAGALTVLMATPMTTAFITIGGKRIQENEVIKYSKEIEQYMDEVDIYGQKIKSYNLTDIQNIMKLMDDMWRNIKGYGEPRIDLISYPGLDLATEDAIGVCRNMADDMARKLNAINEEYNARSITVYFGDGNYEMANIEQNVIEEDSREEEEYSKEEENSKVDGNDKQEENSKVEENDEQEENSKVEENNKEDESNKEENNDENSKLNIILNEKIIGNHAVVLLDLPGRNINLIVDPTNPSIGVFQNGKIVMFNQKDDGNIITYKPATEIIFDGLQAVINIPNNYISSFGNEDLEELDKEFGIAAQNTALEQVRALNSNDWLESIKIDKSKLKENKKTSEDKTENIKIEDEYTR